MTGSLAAPTAALVVYACGHWTPEQRQLAAEIRAELRALAPRWLRHYRLRMRRARRGRLP